MLKKVTAIGVYVPMLFSMSFGNWVSFEDMPPEINLERSIRISSSNVARSPEVSIVREDNSGITVRVELGGMRVFNEIKGGKTFQRIDLMTDQFTSDENLPKLPFISEFIAIPDGMEANIESVRSENSKKLNGFSIESYTQERKTGGVQREWSFTINGNQENNGFYPVNIAEISPSATMRGINFIRLLLHPVRVDWADNTVKIVTSFTIRINYRNTAKVKRKYRNNMPESPAFRNIYKHNFLNYKTSEKNTRNRDTTYDVMLCIVPDDFADDFKEYAAWKHRSGTYIHVTKLSDIQATSNDFETVKNHILDAYNNWQHPPTHVLLVGDKGIVPVKNDIVTTGIINEGGSICTLFVDFYTDTYYGFTAGNDFVPDILCGRIPANNKIELRNMLKKILAYERKPYMDKTAWYKKATICCAGLYKSQADTKLFTAGLMMDDGEFNSVDTMFTINGNDVILSPLSDVISRLSDGRSFLNYRGEGDTKGWGTNKYEFLVSDVSKVNNENMITFVTSIGCAVANFGNEDGDCFGEAWLKVGTEQKPRGACAFIGPVNNTRTKYNNRIDKGIYTGLFQEGLYTPGSSLLRGLMRMYKDFGTNDTDATIHAREYCVLGDPSMHIWKDIPAKVTCEFPETLPMGKNAVSCKVLKNSAPIHGVRVCICDDSTYAVGFTDSNGVANLSVDVKKIGDLMLTVIGKNVIPIEDTIKCVATGIFQQGNLIFQGKFQLEKISPNPFYANTVISYSLPSQGRTQLRIYNSSGKLVRILKSENSLAGRYSTSWNGLDSEGRKIGTGIYICQLQHNKKHVQRMRVVKIK